MIRLVRLAAAVLLLAVLASLPSLSVLAAPEAAGPPVADWRQRLGRLEAALGRLQAADAEGRQQVAADLKRLREDIEAWLAAHPPAQRAGTPWLGAAGPTASIEDLAAELGGLRAAVSRVASALGAGGDSGAFYLGRVDVAVTAEAAVSATTEITPVGASVIGAEELRAYDRVALAGALQLAPGVSFVRIGQRNESAVYVRGFDMRQVPLFVDGIPVYTPYDGYVDLDRFTTYDMAELRVSKGFSSVLYGPNALGGAINIVSRRPAGRIEGTGGASYGSGGTRSGHVNLGSRMGGWYAQGSGSYLQSDTFPLSGGFTPVKSQAAGDRLNAYRRDGKFSGKIGVTPNGTDEYAVAYAGQRGRKGNPPYAGTDTGVRTRYWQWPYWDKDSLYFVSNTHLGESAYLRGRAYHDRYGNELWSFDDATYTTQVRSSSFRSVYKDATLGGSLEWGTTLGSRQTLRAAGHFKQDSHKDRNLGEPDKDFEGRLASIGVEETVALTPRLSVVAGASADWQTTAKARDYQKGQVLELARGDARGVNPQAGVFYSTGSGTARLTVARKTRMPSIKDRYSYKLGTAVPNPDLRPEHALTAEAGYQGALGTKTAFQASLFYSRIDDLMQRVYLQPNLTQLQNIGRASHAGIELDARTRILPRVDLNANYSYLRRRNLSDSATPLVDTPRHKGLVALVVEPFAALRVMANVEFESGRRTQNEAARYLDVPSFATASVKASWRVAKWVDAELGLVNAFDKSYWVSDGYPEAGRTVTANLRVRYQ